MNQSKIKEYLENVTQEVRWKKAHSIVIDELSNHITDEKDYLLSKGCSEIEAENLAIEQMGDASEVGLSFDKMYKPKIAYDYLAFVVLIMIVGIYFQSMIYTDIDISRLIIYACFGILFLVAGYLVDVSNLTSLSMLICMIGAVVFVVFSPDYHGISIFYELLLLMPLFYSIFTFSFIKDRTFGFIKSIFLVPLIGLCSLNSLSMLFLHLVSAYILLSYTCINDYFNIGKKKSLAIMHSIVFVGASFVLLFFNNSYGYRLSRLNPFRFLSENDVDWQTYMIREINSSLNLIGKGNTILSDYVAAISNMKELFLLKLAYEYGSIVFIIAILVLILYIMIGKRMISKQKGKFLRLISVTILSIYACQFIFYSLYNIGFTITSYTLPLFSYGVVSLFVNMFLAGILASCYKTGEVHKDAEYKENFIEKKLNLPKFEISIKRVK